MKTNNCLFLLTSLLFTSLLGAAQAPKGGYQVLGDVQGLPEGSKVYLLNGNQHRTIDSAAVHGGQFKLAGQLAEPAHLYLHAGKGRTAVKLADLLLDNRTVYVKGQQPTYEAVAVTGSDIDQHWKDWYREDSALGAQRYQLKLVADNLTQKQDTASASAVRRVMAKLQAYRVRLLKDYVARYHDSATGAMLPDLCTLSTSLTSADYLQMYQVLTPTWQASSFGKDLLVQAKKKAASTPTLAK